MPKLTDSERFDIIRADGKLVKTEFRLFGDTKMVVWTYEHCGYLYELTPKRDIKPIGRVKNAGL